jgi:hypothetical protein
MSDLSGHLRGGERIRPPVFFHANGTLSCGDRAARRETRLLLDITGCHVSATKWLPSARSKRLASGLKDGCDIGHQSLRRRLPTNDASQPKCLEASLGKRLLTGERSC